MPSYKFYIEPGFSIDQWYVFNLTPSLVNDYFTTGSDSLLFGSYATPTEIASGTVDRWIQVYPGVSRDVSIEYDIWDHKHRRKLKGDLTFMNNQVQLDYSILADIISNSLEVKIRVEQTCSTTASDWWEGYFSIVDGNWDADRGLFVVNPSPDDIYRQFEEQGDKEFNLIDIHGDLSETFSYPIAQQMIMSQGVDPGTSNTLYESLVPLKDAVNLIIPPPTSNDVWSNWYQWAPIISSDLSTWYLRWYRDLCTAPPNATYVRNSETTTAASDVFLPQFLYEYPTDTTGQGFQFHSALHNGKHHWGDMVDSDYIYDPITEDSTPTTTVNVKLNARGFLMSDAIQYIVGAISSGSVYKSSFFNNDNYPDGNLVTPTGDNYITGYANKLNRLVMYQKSDIYPTSDPAKIGKITFNDFMDYLKNTFNIDWYVDANGDFRIEHWYYFENTMGSDLDLTLLDGGKWAFHKNKWSFDGEAMPNTERFKFMEAFNPDFVGLDIIYDRIATFNRYKDNVKEYNVGWTTDIMYAYGFKDGISGEGWILLQTDDTDTVETVIGKISGLLMPNAMLSWANLHWNYWRHGRVLDRGNMNGSDIIFQSYQRHIKQVEITYPECCGEFDPVAFKITGLGEGQVRTAEYRLLDGSVKTVFFYHSVNTNSFPEPETYFIMLNSSDIWLSNDTDKFIHHD